MQRSEGRNAPVLFEEKSQAGQGSWSRVRSGRDMRARKKKVTGHLGGLTLSDKGSHCRVLHKDVTQFCGCFKKITLISV